jgi:hypothetical protein
MKSIFITLILLLLSSCSLFEKTPQSVVDGQRAVYQGVIAAEENINVIIDRYIRDCKATVTYHENFIFEPKIDSIRLDPSLSKEEKSLQITELERERQKKLDSTFASIEKIGEDMRAKALQNLTITKKLVTSIYNYMSTSPIEIDNLEFWIEKLKQVSEKYTDGQ